MKLTLALILFGSLNMCAMQHHLAPLDPSSEATYDYLERKDRNPSPRKGGNRVVQTTERPAAIPGARSTSLVLVSNTIEKK